jgi:hypothetical protein
MIPTPITTGTTKGLLKAEFTETCAKTKATPQPK